MNFERNHARLLRKRLIEPVNNIVIVAGPRQVGKTTMVQDVVKQFGGTLIATEVDEISAGLAVPSKTPTSRKPGARPDAAWLIDIWKMARCEADKWHSGSNAIPYVLAIDEIQKVPNWSDTVKGLWDADRRHGRVMHVVLLGSSPLLMQKGETESLLGRFEKIDMPHWSYSEMQQAFGFTLDEFVYFGGYPKAASYIYDPPRWRSYVKNSIVNPVLLSDIMDIARVDKPAVLRNVFEISCVHSSQIVSMKTMSNLIDGVRDVTAADHLEHLHRMGVLVKIPKFTGSHPRQRSAPPKLNILNTALMSAQNTYSFDEAKQDRAYWGRLIESAVGAHIHNSAVGHGDMKIFYWREKVDEVDFVIESGKRLVAIEVKSGAGNPETSGMARFTAQYPDARKVLVGKNGISVAEFLSEPIQSWVN